mmetsp:Transcript_1449/g.2509  ORF Transcript_1449/g.2509 Transcript_1449/m.2509 type:complete len:265 (+) Transcript_1449:768-1562(+)
MLAGLNPEAGGLHSNEAHILVLNESIEQSDGVGATTHARYAYVGEASELLLALPLSLVTDHFVELTHHHGVRVGAGCRAENVVGALNVGDPVADGLRGRVLERGSSRMHRAHFRTQQTHAEHIQCLALYVHGAHVDDAFQSEARAHGGGGHAVLPRAGLGNHPLLAHAERQHRLCQRVVDLVGAGVVEVLALEVDLHVVAQIGAHALREVQRRLAPDKVLQVPGQYALELRILDGRVERHRELVERVDERLRHVPPAVLSVTAG